jgi:surfactin synthase thioesterase subunit
MELENWAETLLLSLNEVRTTDKVTTNAMEELAFDNHISNVPQEKTRPLLFVSHSLGGLIVRKVCSTPRDNLLQLTQLPGYGTAASYTQLQEHQPLAVWYPISCNAA